MQKDNGTENWQKPVNGQSADEDILRGYINGLAAWPANGSPTRGVNELFSQFDIRQDPTTGGATPSPAPAPYGDTRIRFQIEAVRYYRSTLYWDMSNGALSSCEAGGCLPALYNRFVANSASNSGIIGQNPLTADEQNGVIHVFFGENPGAPGVPLDRYGVPASRYGTGGAAGYKAILMRGHYWSLRHHPLWAPGLPTNLGDQQASFKYSLYVMAHELGHCLGLPHTFDGDGCVSVYNDPTNPGKGLSNNVMDYPTYPGLSLSQCQIGKMHDVLSSGGGGYYVDETQVRDHWTRLPNQDNVISTTQTWSTIHNLRGNLYVQPGVVLTVQCRVGLLGPTAKIVVRRGGQLIFEGGTLGNYATSDRTEAPQNLRLLLGGDPANDPNDTDNEGVITFNNPSCRLQSTRVTAELAAGATLHLASSAVLTVDDAQLTTLAGSYLCIEPGAQMQYANNGRFTTAPNTILGVGPNVVLNPMPSCIANPCQVSGQLLSLTGSVAQNTVVCPQAITLAISGVRLPSPNGFTYQWSFDNVVLAGQLAPVLNHTPPANSGSATRYYVYTCTVQPPGGCPPVLLTYRVGIASGAGTTTLLNSTPSICLPASGSYNLINLVASVVSNPREVSWAGNFVTRFDPFDPTLPPVYTFNATAAWQQGTQHTLTVCNRAPGTGCGTCATVTLTLLPPPALTVTTSTPTICPGEITKLVATAPAGTTFNWQPGNSTGPTLEVMPTVSGTYTYAVTATNAAGCSSRQTIQLVVRPATCPVCQPTVVQMNPIQNGVPITAYSAGYTFLSGQTYYFSTSTTLTSGTYVAQPGARLLFDKEVYLTLDRDASLRLQGATLTATCDQQWGGILIKGTYGLMAQNTGSFTNEISHSSNGIVLQYDPYIFPYKPGTGVCLPLVLDGVAFRNNLRSIQIQQGAGEPGQVSITDCTFQSDPQQMMPPYAYMSATKQWCSYAHLTLYGDVQNMNLTGNTFRGALFGIWAPDALGLTARRNNFADCYIAGALNLFNTQPSRWGSNVFTLATPDNGFVDPANDFVANAYTDLADLGAIGPVPREISSPGSAVGLCASGEPLIVEENEFRQPQALRSYSLYNSFPQTGLWAGPGTVALHNNLFENLHLGAVAQAQQPGGGVADGNTFVGCRTGLAFLNRDPGTPPGDVKLTCNSFQQPANPFGQCYGIYLGPGPYVAGTPGQQVNISREPIPGTANTVPILQTNRFTGGNPNNAEKFYHVYTDVDNTRLIYTRYNASANPLTPTVVLGDATVAGDGSGSTNATALVTSANDYFDPGVNDCAARGYPTGVGLRPTQPGNGPALVPYYLAQNAPNPCAGSTSVAYRLPAGETGELVVRDTFSGRVWLRQALNAGEHTVEVRLEKLPPGAYHYSLEVDGRPVAHHQLLVQ